jgi:hypothetical protein
MREALPGLRRDGRCLHASSHAPAGSGNPLEFPTHWPHLPPYREALRGAVAQINPSMLHQSMPGCDLCHQMPVPRIPPPLREKHEQRHRNHPHELALRRGAQRGIQRVCAREIIRLGRGGIKADAAWHSVSPSFFTPVAAATLFFQTPGQGFWVTAQCWPASTSCGIRARVSVVAHHAAPDGVHH